MSIFFISFIWIVVDLTKSGAHLALPTSVYNAMHRNTQNKTKEAKPALSHKNIFVYFMQWNLPEKRNVSLSMSDAICVVLYL